MKILLPSFKTKNIYTLNQVFSQLKIKFQLDQIIPFYFPETLSGLPVLSAAPLFYSPYIAFS
jgi:hypothetical protein